MRNVNVIQITRILDQTVLRNRNKMLFFYIKVISYRKLEKSRRPISNQFFNNFITVNKLSSFECHCGLTVINQTRY